LKWLGYLLGIALFGLIAAFALAWILVDAGQVTNAAANQLAMRIGRRVELGAIDLSMFPSPAVRVQDVRVGGARAGEAKPLLRAREVRFSVSLLALFLGKTVFRSVDIESPRLELALGPDGVPVIPPADSDEVPAGATSGDAPDLLITSLRVHDGSAKLGDVEVTAIEIDGGANLGLTADFDVTAKLPGVGSIEDGRIELSNFVEGPLRWKAEFGIGEVDLAETRRLWAPNSALYGDASARIELRGEAGRIDDGSLQVALEPLDYRGDGVRINGTVSLRADLGDRFELDLSAAKLELSDLLSKPAGGVFKLTGKSPTLPLLGSNSTGSNSTGSDMAGSEGGGATELRDWTLTLGSSELRGDARLAAGGPTAEFAGTLDFPTLSKWSPKESFPKSGKLRLEKLRYSPSEGLQGEALVDDVDVVLSENFTLALAGPLFVNGSTLGSRDLSIRWNDQNFGLNGSYDFASRNLDAELTATGIELDRISASFSGEPAMTGRGYARVAISGPPSLDGIVGNGEFEIPGGEMLNVSLIDFLSNQGTTVPEGAETFKRLAGVFEIRDATLTFSRLVFEQGIGSANLTGTLSLRDGQLTLRGEARYFDGADVIASPMKITGPMDGFRTEIEKPEQEAERLETERGMLEAMKAAIEAREPQQDPATAKMFREQLQRINELLDKVKEQEAELPKVSSSGDSTSLQ